MTVPVLHRSSVLVLNRHWLAIDAVSPVVAFGHLATGSARALRIDGDSIQPFDWEDWRGLEVPDGAPVIETPGGCVRIPTVIVLTRYAKVPMIRPVFGFRGLWERDGGRCQYTGRDLKVGEANIDHILPRSRGGVDSWENCVLADRKVNTRKGALTPEEAGLQLLSVPLVPKAVPATVRIRNFWNVEEWRHFL
jgi:5-methylcytosine-specific restriction endonuclease McrA